MAFDSIKLELIAIELSRIESNQRDDLMNIRPASPRSNGRTKATSINHQQINFNFESTGRNKLDYIKQPPTQVRALTNNQLLLIATMISVVQSFSSVND